MKRSDRAIKMEQTYIKKFGSYEKYKEWRRSIASKGGSFKGKKGFAVTGLASEAGKRGGSVSRKKTRKWNTLED